VLILVWGINFLKGIHIFSNQGNFIALYIPWTGLPKQPVQINGFKVGQVREVKFIPGTSGRILVSFLLSDGIPIPANSLARIVSADIMDQKRLT